MDTGNPVQVDSNWPVWSPPADEFVHLQIDRQTTVSFAWGPFWVFGSAAYWVSQYFLRFGSTPPGPQPLGKDLLEEVAACILGGHGIRAEVGLAAFERVRAAGLLQAGQPVASQAFRRALEIPLLVHDGAGEYRRVRYRFASQRALRLAAATRLFAEQSPPDSQDPLRLREWLRQIHGVGPKTASWVVRNQTGTDKVAIIDVHILRAGLVAGFFRSEWRLPKDYARFEVAFLRFAEAGGVPASGLDALIWKEQRIMSVPRAVPTRSRARHGASGTVRNKCYVQEHCVNSYCLRNRGSGLVRSTANSCLNRSDERRCVCQVPVAAQGAFPGGQEAEAAEGSEGVLTLVRHATNSALKRNWPPQTGQSSPNSL